MCVAQAAALSNAQSIFLIALVVVAIVILVWHSIVEANNAQP